MPNRFLLIDGKGLNHIGASIKDLGKKWFAFSRMDSLVKDVERKLGPRLRSATGPRLNSAAGRIEFTFCKNPTK